MALKNSMAPRKANLQQLKAAIPSHCFKPSLTISISYLARDFFLLTVLVCLAWRIDQIPFRVVRILAWIFYTIAQGLVSTGIWILAHECGHGGFSEYNLLNDCLGWLLHSILLVPYFSWKITHARHHRYNAHMEKDTAFVPSQKHELEHRFGKFEFFFRLWAASDDTPLMSAITLIGHQLVGWQMYLLFNVSAGENSGPAHDEQSNIQQEGSRRGLFLESHFNPLSHLFTHSQRQLVAISNFGLAVMLFFLWKLYLAVGLNKVLLIYFIPYIQVNHWLVAITYLHHTSPEVMKFSSQTWSYTEGALSTVDRPLALGWIGRHFFHDIADYHVVHHLFPRIPFYWCEEATMAIREMLGEAYVCAVEDRHSNTHVSCDRRKWGFMHALWTTWNKCKYVSEEANPGLEGSGIRAQGTGVFKWAHH